jgi:hypothetical protein
MRRRMDRVEAAQELCREGWTVTERDERGSAKAGECFGAGDDMGIVRKRREMN